MAGRPSKLTPELTEQIAQLLRVGNFVETVCDYVGIHKDTFYEWMKRGERAGKRDIDGGYVAFSDAIKKAISQAELLTVAELKSGPQNWQAKAWWLERRYPDKWGHRSKQTSVQYNFDVRDLPDDILQRIADGEEVDLTTIARQSRTRKKTAPADSGDSA